MVIHTKEKTRIHARGKQETRIRGRNVLTVTRCPGVPRSTAAQAAYGRQRAETLSSARYKRNMGHCNPESWGWTGSHYASRKPPYVAYPGGRGRIGQSYAAQKPVRKRGSSALHMAGTASAKTALDQMEGGDVFYDACMTADFLVKPVKNTS